MSTNFVKLGKFKICNDATFILFGGLNVLEDMDQTLFAASKFVETTSLLNIPHA